MKLASVFANGLLVLLSILPGCNDGGCPQAAHRAAGGAQAPGGAAGGSSLLSPGLADAAGAAGDTPTIAGSAGSTVSAGSAGKAATERLLIDDGDDGDETTRLGGWWITYDDGADNGESTVSPAPWDDGLPFPMSEPGNGDSGYAARMSGTTGTVLGYDYFGMLVGLGPKSFCPDPEPPEFSLAWYAGLRFMAKGSRQGGTFTVIIGHRKDGSTDNCSNGIVGDTLTEWADFRTDITPRVTEYWTLIEIDFRNDLLQPAWGVAVDLETVLNRAKDIVWQYENGNGGAGELWVDNVELYP